jgi:hypothetical protein
MPWARLCCGARETTSVVIPRESGGIQSTQAFAIIREAAEYWIARRSLSSGGHSADPLAGDDG